MIDEPRHLGQLQARLRNHSTRTGRKPEAVERVVGNVVVGQMLPPGVIKGGTALKIRMGDRHTRFSRDLDAARADGMGLDAYLDTLDANLAAGWHGFTGTVRHGPPPRVPPSVPPEYVMKPFKVALAYKGSRWITIDLELGHDEVGSTAGADLRIADDILETFEAVGLARPDPIPLLPVDHQIAQKLHACTWVGDGAGNERAHDLVDLQVLVREERPDFASAGVTASRLFASRRAQAWKPVVVAYAGWERSTPRPRQGSTSCRRSRRRSPGRTRSSSRRCRPLRAPTCSTRPRSSSFSNQSACRVGSVRGAALVPGGPARACTGLRGSAR